MPTARAFRHGLPTGHDGEEYAVDSNFASGRGPNIRDGRALATGAGYGTGQGYSTGQSPAAPTPLSRVSQEQIQTPAARVPSPVSRVAPVRGPNLGGTITSEVAPGVTAIQSYAPSAYTGSDPNRPNSGGTLTRGDVTRVVPPSPAAIRSTLTKPIPPALTAPLQPALNSPGDPADMQTTNGPLTQQKESANPLSGDTNAVPGGVTTTINPGSALGLSRRGNAAPAGRDVVSSRPLGGSGGILARNFSTPQVAAQAASYVKRLGLG